MICPIMNAGIVRRKDVIDGTYNDFDDLFIVCEKDKCALWIGTYEEGMCAITKIALKE